MKVSQLNFLRASFFIKLIFIIAPLVFLIVTLPVEGDIVFRHTDNVIARLKYWQAFLAYIGVLLLNVIVSLVITRKQSIRNKLRVTFASFELWFAVGIFYLIPTITIWWRLLISILSLILLKPISLILIFTIGLILLFFGIKYHDIKSETTWRNNNVPSSFNKKSFSYRERAREKKNRNPDDNKIPELEVEYKERESD